MIVKRRISEGPDGLAALLGLLAEAGDTAEDPLPGRDRDTPGLLVASLRVIDRPIYAIIPMAVARYREWHTVSRGKSDHAAAMTLASILRTNPTLTAPCLATATSPKRSRFCSG